MYFVYFFFKEIPHFLTSEECDFIIRRAEETGLISSIARGGLTKREDLEEPKVESRCSFEKDFKKSFSETEVRRLETKLRLLN